MKILHQKRILAEKYLLPKNNTSESYFVQIIIFTDTESKTTENISSKTYFIRKLSQRKYFTRKLVYEYFADKLCVGVHYLTIYFRLYHFQT